MQFTASLVAAFLLAATPVLGFTVPEGTPDGVYTVEYNEAGEEVHTRQGDVSSSAVVPRAMRGSTVKRDGLDQFGCFKDQLTLNGNNLNAAVAALRAQIAPTGTGLGSHKGLYSISGEVVAYCCNNRAQGNTCFLSDQADASTHITGLCGLDGPGYAYNSGAHLTYGYQHTAYSWCPEH